MSHHSFQKKRYIVPPGLQHLITEFEEHVKVGGDTPIMICGASGVGKSLFLHIYKKLYQEQYGADCRIETVNCSHFGGGLARSELFGHRQGSFTGAFRDNKGWLKQANHGVLVLEEIGDLPEETQANLLTFVETCQFHQVGSTFVENANVRIVAATNREDSLRTDFRNRFFPFYVPSLCKRRYDILYYLSYRFPQLLATLAPWEIMVLLTYNWPGNVREIEKVGRLLMCKKPPEDPNICPDIYEDADELAESDIFALPEANANLKNIKLKKTGLCSIGSESTDLKGYIAFQLYNDLKYFGVDVNLLETVFNRYNIGLALNNETHPFGCYQYSDPREQITIDPRFDVAVYPPIAAFTSAYLGVEAYAAVFWRQIKENANLLDLQESSFTVPFSPINRFFALSSPNIDLFNSIAAYIRQKIKKRGKTPEESPSKTKAVSERTLPKELGKFSYNQLLKTYFRTLLARTAGNQARAARIAKLKYTTFRQKLKKFKVI